MSARDNHDLSAEEARDQQISKLTRIHTVDVRKLLAEGDGVLLDRVADAVVNDLGNVALAQSIVRALAGFPDGKVGASLLAAVLERAIDAEAEILAIADVERMEASRKDEADEDRIEQAVYQRGVATDEYRV